MTEAELNQEWTGGKARIDAANAPQQAARKKALAAGVPWPEQGGTEAVSEQVAFDALKAAYATVVQAEAALAQAKDAETQALASFRNTVAEKVAIIERETAYWERGLELKAEAEKPPVPALVGSSLVPDEKFSLTAFSGALLLLLTAVGKMVAANAKEAWPDVKTLHAGNLGAVNNAVTAATMQQVGRSVGAYLFMLELIGRVFGTDWHITESKRLFIQLRKNLIWDTATIWGVTISLWRPRSNWKGMEALNSTANGLATIRNDKELNLLTGTVGGMAYRFFEMLRSGAKDFATIAEDSLEVVLRLELLQALLGRGDLMGYTDRVIHPFVCIMKYMWQQGRIAEAHPAIYERVVAKLHKEMGDKIKGILPAKAADRVKQCDDRVARMTIMLENEIADVEQDVNGQTLKSYTWAYNVLGMTPGASKEDGYQPLVYVKLLQTLLMEVGVYGLGMFATDDFQRKLANTQYAGVQPQPLQYRCIDEENWNDTLGWNTHCPIAERFVDGKDAEGQVHKFRFKARHGGYTRVLVTRPVVKGSDGERYFEANKKTWGDVVGPSLMFATGEHVKFSQREWGTPENITSRGDDIGWCVGMALREARTQGLVTWS